MAQPTKKNKNGLLRQLNSRKLVGPQLLFFGAIFAAIGAYFIWRTFAAPPAPTIYLTPPASTFAANTTFSVQVREDSGSTAVNAVQANFTYPANLVDFVSISGSGSAFSTEAETSGTNGTVKIARGICGGCAAVTGDQLVATVTFRTKTTTGTANMAFVTGTALLSSSTNQTILPSLSATGSGSYLVDVTAPTVSISAPANGSNVSKGSATTVTATVSDNDQVSSVDIFIDGSKVATLTSSPYSYVWNTTSVAYGPHNIYAVAVDPSNNTSTSTTVSVTVVDTTPPIVSITAPSSGAFLRGTVNFEASATDNSSGTGISKVEFYVDSVLKNTDTTAPYSFSWDTLAVSNGSRDLTVKAYDAAIPANTTTSAVVNLTVDNSAPTTPGDFRTTGNSLNSISLAWNASTDNQAVTGYRLSRNGAVVATTSGSTLSYADSGLTGSTTYSYTLVALDAAGNTSAVATLSAATQTAIPGDINGDGRVNVTDLSILLSNWSTSNAGSDINKDGTVNIFDLSILLSRWTG